MSGCREIFDDEKTKIGIAFSGTLNAEPEKVATRVTRSDAFKPFETGSELDTVWLARAGAAVISFCSTDNEGLPAHIHRPEDTIDKIHWSSVNQAIDFAKHICDYLLTNQEEELPKIPKIY